VRHSPTTPAQDTDIQIKESQLKSLKDQLTVLHDDLYWMAMEAAKDESPLTQLNLELLTGLKSAIDAMRLLLRNCIETAFQISPQTAEPVLEVQRLQRSTQFLQLLRKRLAHDYEQEPVSFIERISAAMKDRIANKGDSS
jgi:hypothetical protein